MRPHSSTHRALVVPSASRLFVNADVGVRKICLCGLGQQPLPLLGTLLESPPDCFPVFILSQRALRIVAYESAHLLEDFGLDIGITLRDKPVEFHDLPPELAEEREQ